MILYPLYIDPGTGSVLFSIAIGIAAAAYFLLHGLILMSEKASVRHYPKPAGQF
jgi:hypothetical protein